MVRAFYRQADEKDHLHVKSQEFKINRSLLVWAIEQEITVAQLECVGLPVRVINALEEEHEIIFVEDLLCFTEQEIKKIPNFGVTAWKQIVEALSKVHLIEEGEELLSLKKDESYLRGGTNFMFAAALED